MLTRRSLLAASAASPVLSYVGGMRAEAATPKDVVVMGKQIDDMIALDPAQAYEFTDNELDGNIYRKLVMPDPKTGTTVIGDLAEKFEVSADGLTFTFHMRRDARFDSGKPVTAQDAEFSFHRIVQMNKTPAFIITQFGFDKDNVAKLIRATDDTTLVMTLPAPQATSFVLFCISANVGGIVEKAAALEHQQDNDFGNAWLNNNSAGAGPFKLSSWKASDTVILDANPHAATPPGAKRVVIRHMKDPSTQLLSLQRGDIDIARNLGADQLKSLVGNANFHTVSAPQGTSMYFAMNRAVPELAKKEVQQAIKWAIDYEAIAKNITPGVWRVSQSFLPVGLPGALPETPFHKDVAKAKQLMAAAGLAGGFSVSMDYSSIWPTCRHRAGDPGGPRRDRHQAAVAARRAEAGRDQDARAAAPDGAADVVHRLHRSEFQCAGLVRRPGRFRRQQAEDPGLAQPLRRQGDDGRGGSGDQGTRRREAHGDLCQPATADVGTRAVRLPAAGRRDRGDAEECHWLPAWSDA